MKSKQRNRDASELIDCIITNCNCREENLCEHKEKKKEKTTAKIIERKK